MPIPVIGLGAGGHAKVVIEILRMDGRYELIGLLDRTEETKGMSVLGVPILGDDRLLLPLRESGIQHFFMGLGSAGNIEPRRNLYTCAVGHGFVPISAIHPRAIISPSAMLGVGVTIAAGAVLNASATLGANVIINTGAIVEHDCKLGDHVHVATGARLASTVHVGASAHIGAGASIRQCVRIGEGAVVGAGAVVVNDVEPWTVVVGVPARVMREVMG